MSSSAPSAPRVVIAEDEALIRLDLAEMLGEEGYDVVGQAGDGEAAIALVMEHRPDLVVMDVKMPKMDGIAAAEIIAAERDTLAVPVTAIGSTPAGSMVMRVKDGVVERVSVRTGIRDGGLVEITQDLAPGDRVVTKAGGFVRDGDRINPIPAATN